MMDKRDIKKKYGLPTAPPPYDDIVDWARLEIEAEDPTGWDWHWRKFARLFYNWQQAQTATMTEVVAEYDRVCGITPRPAPTEHTRKRLEPLVEDMRAFMQRRGLRYFDWAWCDDDQVREYYIPDDEDEEDYKDDDGAYLPSITPVLVEGEEEDDEEEDDDGEEFAGSIYVDAKGGGAGGCGETVEAKKSS